MFKVGQKVVCLASFTEHRTVVKWRIAAPKKDEIYTIRAVPCPGYILLEEIVNPIKTDDFNKTAEPRWDSDYFRAVDESFSESILAGIKEKIKEEQLTLI